MAFNRYVCNKIPPEELMVFFKVIQQINQIVDENNISQIVASNNQYETNHK